MSAKDAPPPSADRAAALLSVPGPSATLGKAQRLFNRLTGQIRRQRERLEAWQTYRDRYHERIVAEMDPAHAAVRNAQRKILQQMDILLERDRSGSAEQLSRRNQATLRTHVAAICAALLAHGDDPEITAIRDRHAASARRTRKGGNPLAANEAMLRELFGDDVVDGHTADSVEALMEQVRGRLDAREAAEAERHRSRAEERAAKRGRPTRAEQAAERRTQFMKEASQSVREIYRRLASTLHPDRESDPVERARKTLLMQRANQAYAGDDLLALLALQIEIEQIDASHLAQASDTRIAHFNEVLKEQLAALQAETDACAAPILYALPLFSTADEVAADHAFNARVARLRAFRRQLERDAKALADPRRRHALLDALGVEHDPSVGDEDIMSFDDLFDAAPPARRPRRRS
jgi:hypothetical protein